MRSIFLALTITTAYAHLRGWPEELHPVLRACFAVLVLVLGVGLWRKRERPACSPARAVRAPRWPDYAAIGLGVLAIECLFLFFLSAVPPRAEQLAYTVEEFLLPQRAAARHARPEEGGGDGTHGTTLTGNWLWDDQGKRRLPLSTNAKPSKKPEAWFRPADERVAGLLLRGKAYIRAFALERYKEAAWLPLDLASRTLTPADSGWIPLEQPSGRPGPVLRGTIAHGAHPSGQDVFTAPQGATGARLGALRHIDPGIFRLNPLHNPEAGYTYEVAAKTVTLDTLLEGGAVEGFRLPEDIPEHLVETPVDEDLKEALIHLANQTLGPTEARLLALRKLLRREFTYSLKVENPDQLDPILNFLLHEKKGHCEFFATAGALLCRTLNIPARVAYGWVEGRYYPAQNLFMFSAEHAHAWTEVYLKDIGWVVFDTTPPSAIGGEEDPIASPDEEPPLDENLAIGSHPEESSNPQIWTYLALAVGLGLVPLVVLLLRLRKRSAIVDGATPTSLLPESPGYLERFRKACQHLGVPMPPGRTLRQHLAALARDDRKPAFAQDLLEYHYAITYGDAKPNKLRESSLVRAIRRWE